MPKKYMCICNISLTINTIVALNCLETVWTLIDLLVVIMVCESSLLITQLSLSWYDPDRDSKYRLKLKRVGCVFNIGP